MMNCSFPFKTARHIHNWIDYDVVFCIFGILDLAVDYFKFIITLLIVDRFAVYILLRFIAINEAYNCNIWG